MKGELPIRYHAFEVPEQVFAEYWFHNQNALVSLKDISPVALDTLCKTFTAEVFKKAGKDFPAKEKTYSASEHQQLIKSEIALQKSIASAEVKELKEFQEKVLEDLRITIVEKNTKIEHLEKELAHLKRFSISPDSSLLEQRDKLGYELAELKGKLTEIFNDL